MGLRALRGLDTGKVMKALNPKPYTLSRAMASLTQRQGAQVRNKFGGGSMAELVSERCMNS